MGRQTMMTALSIVCASCLAASSAGCHGARRCCGCGPSAYGYAAGQDQANCPADCDRYASRTYRRFDCCRPRRDPRIPGPRVVSTLPAPEREAPGYLHPVPTYPVFGPRSEEPDGIEPELQPMLPSGSPRMQGEPLPPPEDDSLLEDDTDDDVSMEEADDDEENGDLKLAAPQQLVQHTGWKPARRQSAQAEAPTRRSANGSLSFRQPSSAAR
jgi:hypothetical protein